MSYVTSTLQQGEEIKLNAKLHWINYLYPSLLLLVALLFLFFYLAPLSFNNSDLFYFVLFFGIWSGYEFLKRYMIEMSVTDKRVVIRKGIISIDSDEVKNSKIEGIEVNQSVMGRILNYGDISFAGVGISKVRFCNISRPKELKSKIETIVGE